jgi:hypothetical protein
MILVNNEAYYIDMDVLDEMINGADSLAGGYIEESRTTLQYDENGELLGKTVEENKTYKPREMDGFKYGFYMNLIEIVTSYGIENEDKMLPSNDVESLPSNILLAFNTLMHKQIIKRI